MDEIKNKLTKDSCRVLVTGGSGLVGSCLLHKLIQQGYQVTAIYHNTPIQPVEESQLLKIIHCDILDTFLLEEIMQDVDKVYHCAALVSFDAADREKLFRINTEGTASVVNAAIASGVKKLLHVSSVAAMGRIRPNELVTEEMQWSEKTSNSIYGKSKYLAEMEVWRGIGEGLESVIVNPTIILGGHSWQHGSGGIFKSVYNEFPWFTEGISGFVGVDDVANAMILLMESKVSGERFILNGVNTSYKDLFDLIANSFGKKKPSKRASPLLSSFIWRTEAVKSWATGSKPLLTRETAATAQAQVTFSNGKIKKYFPDFKFEPLEHTVSKACKALSIKYNL